MFNYDHTGTARTPLDLSMLQKWALVSNTSEASDKESYLSRRYLDISSGVSKTWPPSCIELLLAYKLWLFKLNSQKMKLANQKPGIREDALNELMLQVSKHYQTVLGLFDTAIEKIESDNDVIPL
ncbi:hypothetical protein EST38_g4776 [Candolleomyces aberdarensis]|uniref:Uncharacterized protein n=1 Tax=Candolleomyces aberdarensis TaxID=2316362 RepID=A0A4Q2DQC7_9AGAR|nr:hypothetical protein EST38_g4776 [Candolleomyces aberdarensis]